MRVRSKARASVPEVAPAMPVAAKAQRSAQGGRPAAARSGKPPAAGVCRPFAASSRASTQLRKHDAERAHVTRFIPTSSEPHQSTKNRSTRHTRSAGKGLHITSIRRDSTSR